MNQTHRTCPRKGSAVVELAICLPLVLTLVWGTIEVSNSIFLKQTLTSAAHEGALVGTGHSATAQDITSRVNAVLGDRLNTEFIFQIETATGESFDTLPAGQPFTIWIRSNPESRAGVIQIQEVEARVTAFKQ